ncbi:MAG: arginine deiminase family protein [Polaribacter sp.]|jgi:N-dimethylarginine dimethylaminohydrolase|nr:arginine deiminase family protein [Polaribacter sp.]MDG1528403.1 arginine deiminase family protein [Polaribacter sp.]MDG1954900.1 arginine deiminase family protein [Polaribacter sp.]MDG2074598.1 arginine deiminase family protein [Polaribacter sp.]
MSKTTHHSEYLKLASVYIKSAREAFESDNVLENQWNELNYLSKPDFNLAIKEYEIFESIFIENNIEIKRFPSNENVKMDSIYCRDASIATDFGIIICNMGKDGRINEPKAQFEAYQKQNITVLGEIQSPGTLEGGDVAWLDKKTLAVGHTYRTNEDGIQQLKGLLEPKGIQVVVADLPHYRGKEDVFHLMSILSPVDKNLAVIYSSLMPIKFRNELLNRGFELVEVPEEEFESMGCNVLAISPRNCVMVEGNPITKSLLEEAGCNVTTYSGEEISVKGGGGPTCLTRPLVRIDQIYT